MFVCKTLSCSKHNQSLVLLLFMLVLSAAGVDHNQSSKQQLDSIDISNKIPILSDQIGQQIFHENKIYVIYVYQQESEPAKQIFKEFCFMNGHLCAFLNPEAQKYGLVRSFIGFPNDQYFCIIDAARRKKYVLPIIENMSASDLLIFQSKFEQQTLQPFLASEQPDPQPYEPCRKLVSKDLTEFLTTETPVKVVYLYTLHEACEVCGELLRMYADLADKMYDKTIISFGYYDIFKNDHPSITDQILPYFLIFENGNTEEPQGVPGEDFKDLFDILVQVVMKDVKIPETASDHGQEQWYQQQDLLNVQFQYMNQNEVLLENIDLDEEQILQDNTNEDL